MSPSGRPKSLKLPPPRGTVLRVAVWIVSILLILLVVGLTLADRTLRQSYEPDLGRVRKDVTEHIGFFCEQQALLAKDPWFHEPRTEGDAGPLLNPWISWEPKRQLPRGSPLAIPARLPQSNADFKDWLTSTGEVSTLDFSWMGKLHAYDRWDTVQNTPTPLPEKVDWFQAPVPYLVPMQLWAKFRMLHGLRTGQPAEAARDVRHLAWLLYRTDSYLGAAVAISLLKVEREAYDSLQAPPPEWRPMSQEQLARMRAVLMNGHVFSSLAAPAEVARQARRCGEPVVSLCGSMSEAAIVAKHLQPVAESRYREGYLAFTEDLAGLSCPTSLPRTIWERGTTLEDRGAQELLLDQPDLLKLLPGSISRPHVAGMLLSMSAQNISLLKEFKSNLQAGSFPPAKP
jgi:hypothetical protein